MSTVPIDYTARDYSSMLAALQDAAPTYLPEWTSTSDTDFGQILLQLFSYMGDVENYYLDRIGNEAFLATCQQLQSAQMIAALIGYQPLNATAATANLTLILSTGYNTYPAVIPAGSQFTTVASSSSPAIIFETPMAYTFSSSGTYTSDSNGNLIMVVQGQTIMNEVEGVSTGAPNQTFSLFNTPVISGTVSVYVDEGLGPKLWTQVSTLATAGPTDKVYSLSTDSNGVTWITFGDGYNGAIPATSPANSSGITATYRIGGGSSGNVGANQITVDSTGITGLITSVTNVAAAAGGQDAEGVAEIQQNAPQAITAGGRITSLQDYASASLEVPTVSKASATGMIPSSITVYIHPGTAPMTSANLATAVSALAPTIQTALAPLAPAGVTITVQAPISPAGDDGSSAVAGYVPIAVAATVQALPQYSATQVQQDVVSALTALLGFSASQFGAYIPQSTVLQTILSVAGVQYANLSVFCRYESLTSKTSGALAGPVGDITTQAYELATVQDPNISTNLVQVTVTGGV